MLLSFPGLTKAMDIEKLEAMVFESFAAGVSVEDTPAQRCGVPNSKQAQGQTPVLRPTTC